MASAAEYQQGSYDALRQANRWSRAAVKFVFLLFVMFGVFLCGAAFFTGLFICLRKLFGSVFPHWSEADVVSVSESHWLVNTFVVFGAPYMASDICFMYLTHFHNQRVKGHSSPQMGHSLQTAHSLQTVRAFVFREKMLVLHHLALLLIFLPITLFFRRGLGDFFVGCLFITELSTPFISVGKILIQLGLDHTRLHRVNGIVVLLTFFICRILIFPYMYAMYGRQFGIPLHRVALSLPLHCNVGNVAILLPQVYWFILLLRKAKRLYNKQSRGRRD